jgi:hypothetical protein
MVKGARQIGTLYEIHPYDLAEFFDSEMGREIELVIKEGNLKDNNLIQIGEDFYIQSIERPALTNNFR